MPITKQDLRRDTLRKLQSKDKTGLIDLRLQYSEAHKLLTGYINKLVNVNRIYPHHLPTQASFRWSTLNPPITNWPRACVNPDCVSTEHEWTEQCWSVRDILFGLSQGNGASATAPTQPITSSPPPTAQTPPTQFPIR